MSTVIEFTVPASSCALGRSLGNDPAALLELDRVVPTDDTVMPFFWVWNLDPEVFAAAAETEAAIEKLTVVDRVEEGTLFAARWNRESAGTLFAIVRSEGTLLEARATCEEWYFEVRFADRAATAEFRTFCRERDVPLVLHRLSTSCSPEPERYGLTAEQREALAVAYRRGYFEEPRGATLGDIAEELGISARAVAGRLRRGQATLLEHAGLTAFPA
ncbi:HTH DNA binding domain protein [Halalkalicoccus paucihalophilus]|jgi:predicted DNA binding protein|uniref:HTH DNA binding domain protein n=1 Tax=Halalkalicoccus paucihalophilus TaxID=1008153 RepID=A0A151AG31_9EURY|nr:helix-turn-helix domain-containing protein [Halalkalicoccus paucihalophilus]KYH26357.1 HTH DNA binding domain protein [Halalkalicoccus paucihalophilus]